MLLGVISYSASPVGFKAPAAAAAIGVAMADVLLPIGSMVVPFGVYVIGF